MSRARVLSYAVGDVANNLSFMMTALFLLAYMTDIVGIPAALAGTIYGVSKVWAGVSDLLAGNTVDKLHTRWGRLRPWILFGSFPLAVMLASLFSTPAGLSSTQAVVWILLFVAGFELCYSFVNIPYGALSAAMTQDAVDRSRLAGGRLIASSVTGVLLALVLAPQFENTGAADIRSRFTVTTLILAGLAVILYAVCFAHTREVVHRVPRKTRLRATLGMVRQNRPLLLLCLGALLTLAAMFTMSAVMLFYARYVLGSATAFIWLQIAQTVGMVLIASVTPMITVRLGKRNGFVAMALLAAGASVLIAVVPGEPGISALIVAGIAWFLYGLGVGGVNALMFSMQADTVDYGEWRTGVRAEGGSYAILSFARKCGQGLGGWAGGLVIGLYGYSAHAVAAADPGTMDRIEQGIRIAAGWLPASLGVLGAVVLLAYPLTGDQHRRLVTQLAARRAKGPAGRDPGGASRAKR